MDGISLVQDFGIILLVAAAAGWFMRKIGLSAVVGYLLAGIVIGPFTPPFSLVTDVERIQTAAQLGLVFLMFFVGLNLSLERIRRLGVPIFLATALTAVIVYNLSQLFAWAAGWDNLQALLFAAMLMASSSAIITKMLAENGLTHEHFARNALGLTVLEDVVAVIMLTLIGSRLGGDADGGAALGQTLLLLLGFVVLIMVAGLLIIPRLFEKVGRASDSDLKSILVCGLLFGAGVAAVKAGFSIALGAFLFGVVVAETRFKSAIERRLAGAQDMFSAMFFVAIGMLIDVSGIFDHIPMILAIAAFALIARCFAAVMAFLTTGSDLRTAVASGLAVTPIGEFAYIIAQIGVAAAVFEPSFYLIAVGASIITAVLTPLLAKKADVISAKADALQPDAMRRAIQRYGTWLETAGNRYRQNLVWQSCRGRVAFILIELLLLTGLLGFSKPISSFIWDFLMRTHAVLPGWELGYWACIGAIALVLVVAILRGLASVSTELALSFAGNSRRSRPLRRLIRRSLVAIGAVGLTLLVASLLPVSTSVPWIPLVILCAIIPLAVLFWKRMVTLQARFQSSLQRAVAGAPATPQCTPAVRAVNHSENWNVELAEIILPEQSVHAGRTVSDIALRSDYGCSILEVERQGMVINNPRAEFLLFPEDRLLLFGTAAQLKAAREFLGREGTSLRDESDFDDSVLDTLEVPAGSPRTGKSLIELRLFNVTGIQLMGIERDGVRTLNPPASQTLEAGDLLLALGSHRELRDFRAWLTEPEWKPQS